MYLEISSYVRTYNRNYYVCMYIASYIHTIFLAIDANPFLSTRFIINANTIPIIQYTSVHKATICLNIAFHQIFCNKAWVDGSLPLF